MFILVVFITIAVTAFFADGLSPLLADGDEKSPQPYYLPVVVNPNTPSAKSKDALSLINELRSKSGIAPVSESGTLTKNCYDHARYMAENNVLAHQQDPNLPYASASGQSCAEKSNAWLGSNKENPGWMPGDSVDGWMASVAHRIWLLYPTTRTVGYGFFNQQEENRAAAAIDILSYADFDADAHYNGWPVQYPKGSSNVPSTRYPITLNWRYFGAQPIVEKTQLQTANGRNLAHDATTNLPAGHKGIQVTPRQDLPAYSEIIVTISGSYEGLPFSSTWAFHTGG